MTEAKGSDESGEAGRVLSWEELEEAGISIMQPETLEWLQSQADGLKVILAEDEMTDEERAECLRALDDLNERMKEYAERPVE
jgi:hypothetical protein